MKKGFIATLLVSCSMLSGCVVGGGGYAPAPYYGGPAPYYGTTYAPGYAYGGGGYYPYHSSVNIYSNYNRNYWHYQHAQANGGWHGNGGNWHGGGNPPANGGGHPPSGGGGYNGGNHGGYNGH